MNNLSYVHGATSDRLLGVTVGQLFDETCERYADKDALVVRHQQVRWTYSELKRRVDALACSLMQLGLRPGDRLGIWSGNRAEWTLIQFATAKLGVILVTINPSYRADELAYAITKVGCRAMIMAEGFKRNDYVAVLTELAPELAGCRPGSLSAKRLPSLETVILLGSGHVPGTLRFDDLPNDPSAQDLAHLAELSAGLQFDDPINIQFTSGTTGSPKGATLSHHNIVNNARFVGQAIGLTHVDRVCIPVPLYHCFGMVMGNLGCLVHGATMVYPAESFDSTSTLTALDHERCTAMYGVPTMFISVLGNPEFAAFKMPLLRTGIMAGSPCPIEVMKQVVDTMKMRDVTIAYGMTETSPVSFQSAADDALDKRVATVGRIHPHCEVKIVDDNGRIVARGTPGELCTRGYSVMLGYWDDEERTRQAIDSAGWMHTGDYAVIDDDGYCSIVGRKTDMVIRGGENIYPREIEDFLHRHPHIHDVQVVGVPDAKYGEELCAWIIVREGQQLSAEDVAAFCRGRIAHYKIPRYVKVVESFPMTVTGKVQKFAIRDSMRRELGEGRDDRSVA